MTDPSIPVSPYDVVQRRTDEERRAYTEGFDAGARMVFKGLEDGKTPAECHAFYDRMMYLLRGGQP
jgi:hypothetical protein